MEGTFVMRPVWPGSASSARAVEIAGAVVVDAGQDIGEPAWGSTSLSRAVWISVYMMAARSPPIGAGEQPGLAAERNAAQRPLGGVVGRSAAVGEEAREGLQRLSM